VYAHPRTADLQRNLADRPQGFGKSRLHIVSSTVERWLSANRTRRRLGATLALTLGATLLGAYRVSGSPAGAGVVVFIGAWFVRSSFQPVDLPPTLGLADA
jgi:hypothetical protein